MGQNTSHRITVCTSCRHKGTDCRPGYELIARLRSAMDAAGDAVSEDFEISGVACMAGCDRPCTVAYHGTRKATYLFGDIEPDEDIEDLLAFARHYAALDDGWCSSLDRPGKLRTSTLARVPAAMIAVEQSESRVS
jgi:predicted metal-binding protein